jgi:predicted phosphodiesterase
MSKLTRRQLLKSTAISAFAPAMFHVAGTVLGADTETKKKSAAAKNAADKKAVAKAAKPVNPYIDAKFVDGAPAMPGKDKFTVVVLPDTQHYSQTFPANFHAQTKWIVENQKDRNIAYVMHLGDITNRSTVPEWEVASAAMGRLDHKVPYSISTGNHDYSGSKFTGRDTHFTEYFPLKKIKEMKNFGGTYDKESDNLDNNYTLFDAMGRDFIVIALEYAPRNDVVRWANDILKKYKDRTAILTTHAYMYFDSTRYDYKKYGSKQAWSPHESAYAKTHNDDVNDGEELWNKLVKVNPNVMMTLNGHVLKDGLGHLASKNDAGKDVHQILVNFQMKPNGGDGWLRLLEFSADGKSVESIDYSPTRNQCNVSEQNKFSMQYA